MNDLDRWFHRQAAREARIVMLEEGLLGDRLGSYFWYRLRYFFLTYVIESVAHAVLVLVAFRSLAWDNFLLVVVAQAVTMLLSHFWWGALEAMRARVRDLFRSGRPHRVPSAIAGWMTFASVLGAGFLAMAAGWIAWNAVRGSLGPTEAYVATMMLRLGLDLPTRCYHSGVYALRRVYKPLSATIAPEFLGLVTILGTLAVWPDAGVWALVLSSVLLSVTMTALTLHYTGRVYHFLGFRPLEHVGFPALRLSMRGAVREFLASGASHGVMALDSLVVLSLLYGAQTDSQSLIVLFLSMPTVRAGAEWARLLYFDLKRLELRLFTNLRRRFERHTARLAWLLGLVFWVFAAGITTAFYGHGVGQLYAALLVFFLARSVLAREQIQAFAERSYGAVLGTGALCVAGLGAVGALAEAEAQRLGAVAVVTGASAFLLGRVTGFARAHGEPGTALLTLEWLQRLGHIREPLRLGSARVVSATGPDRLDARTRDERNRWRLSQLAERMARRLGNTGAAAWIGPDRVVWYEPPGDSPRITPEWLQRAAGGLIAKITTRDCPEGEEAILAAAQGGLLGRPSPHLLTAVVPVDPAAARRTFEEVMPGGIVYSPDEPVPSQLAALPGSELRSILFDATAFARDLGAGRRQSRFDVTPLCAGGELQLIFVAQPAAGKGARRRWRHRVSALNVRAAIAGLRQRGGRAARFGRPAFLGGR